MQLTTEDIQLSDVIRGYVLAVVGLTEAGKTLKGFGSMVYRDGDMLAHKCSKVEVFTFSSFR